MAQGLQGKGIRKERQAFSGASALILFDFDLFLHVDLFSVKIVEDVLQESKALIGNHFNAKSVFHLPFSFQGNDALIDIGGDIRVDV